MKKLFLSLAFAACGACAHAQIMYTDVNPDAQVNTWDAYQAHFMNNTSANALSIWFHPWNPNEVVVNAPSTVEVMMDANGWPAFKSNGDSISATGSWKTVSYDTLNFNATRGNWLNDAEGYLGVRFKNIGQWNYGWLKMYVDAAPNGFILEEYAYQRVAGAGLKAGQTSLGISTTMVSDAQIFVDGHLIRVRNSGATQMLLSDMNGRTIAATPLTDKGAAIDGSALPAGIYLVRLLREGRLTAAQKISLH